MEATTRPYYRISGPGTPPAQRVSGDGESHPAQPDDGKFCPAFQHTIDAAGIKRVPLPARSPNLNAFAERWVRSVQDEALSWLILFGEASLWHVLKEYETHYHTERNHQGKGNVLLFPLPSPGNKGKGPIQCHERLGGLLKYYGREAA